MSATPTTTHGPLHACRENPRYFADATGRPVYLTGSHVWHSLMDIRAVDGAVQPFDYDACPAGAVGRAACCRSATESRPARTTAFCRRWRTRHAYMWAGAPAARSLSVALARPPWLVNAAGSVFVPRLRAWPVRGLLPCAGPATASDSDGGRQVARWLTAVRTPLTRTAAASHAPRPGVARR